MNQSGALAEFLIIIHPGFQANIEPTQDSGLDFCLPWADRHNGKVLFSSVPVHPPHKQFNGRHTPASRRRARTGAVSSGHLV